MTEIIMNVIFIVLALSVLIMSASYLLLIIKMIKN